MTVILAPPLRHETSMVRLRTRTLAPTDTRYWSTWSPRDTETGELLETIYVRWPDGSPEEYCPIGDELRRIEDE